MINTKKGVELSLNVVIIAILVIIVLFVLILFFTGGAGSAIDKIKGIFQVQTFDLQKAVITCNSYCNNYGLTGQEKYKTDFCDHQFRVDFDGDGKVDSTTATCSQVGATCDRIPASEC